MQLGRPATGEERTAFERFATDRMAQSAVRLSLLIVGAALLWWPLDRLVYHDPTVADAFRDVRIFAIVVNLVVAATITLAPVPRRHGGVLFGVVVAAQLFVATALFGRAVALDDPQVAFFYLAPFFSTPILVSPGVRSVLALTMASAVWLGFYTQDPGALARPGWLAHTSFLAFSAVLAALLGEQQYRALFVAFVTGERLTEQEQALRRLNLTLEARVDEQTAELRRLTAERDDRTEGERRRIAAELHDELGQQLTAAGLAIDFGRRVTSDDARARVWGELRDLVDGMHLRIREILRGLHPVVLDQLGLEAALQALADETSRRTGLDVSFEVGVSDSLPYGRRSLVLYRAAQEGLTNVVRHAGASQARIHLTTRPSGYELTVEDDGAGLPDDHRPGLGMLGVRERVSRWDGTARWTPRDGGGTRMVVEVPT